MSDTDDTDELLLIPPDLFVIDSEFEAPYVSAPYYSIVDTLITQVNELEDRINYFVTTSDISSVSYTNGSLEEFHVAPTSMSKRIYYNNDNLSKNEYIPSTQSTPQKPRTIFKLNSLPPSPATRHFSPNKNKYVNRNMSPNKQMRSTDESSENQDNQSEKLKLLNEIDNFISNVKLNSRMGVSRNLEKDFQHVESKNRQHSLELKDVNALLENMEATLGNNVHYDDTKIPKVNMLTATSASESNPSTSDMFAAHNDSPVSDDTIVSSSDSTQVTALHNANISSQAYTTNRMHQEIMNGNNAIKDKANNTQKTHRNHTLKNQEETRRLLSLTDLWGQYTFEGTKNNFVSKLEEERLRRKHCEDLIQDLQQKILELQEKLAVAMDVDQNKDEAILRFHDAWEKVAVRFETLKKDKIFLERDLQELQTKAARDLAEAAKKIAYYELEASKALNLAHSSHEKIASLETQNAQTIMEIDNLQQKYEATKNDHELIRETNKQLNEMIAQKELLIKEKDNAVNAALKEVAEGKKTVEMCEAEFISMKTRYTQLELDFNDAQDRIKQSERDKKKLNNEIDSLRKTEKELREQLLKAKEFSDKNKFELRNFYQDQVEIVVRDKLKEFQDQLERAEKSMQEEIKNREYTIAKTAAQHIQNLEEKHNLEVQLLEQKHLEEIRLYNANLGQANQKIENLETKLVEQSERKDKIAHQLHKIMEVQWREALKILNNRTPSSPELYNEQWNQLKSKSYSNLEEILSTNQSQDDDNAKTNKDVMQMVDSTPISSRQPRNRQQIENELQKYIQMLLPKATISAPDTNQNKGLHDVRYSENPTNDKNYWHQQLGQEEYKTNKGGSSKDKRLNKPPWK